MCPKSYNEMYWRFCAEFQQMEIKVKSVVAGTSCVVFCTRMRHIYTLISLTALFSFIFSLHKWTCQETHTGLLTARNSIYSFTPL